MMQGFQPTGIWPARTTANLSRFTLVAENNFVLVTNNRASMPVHLDAHIARGRHVPGILILNPDLTIGENLKELILIAEGSFDDEYQDRIDYLPLP